MSNVKRQKLDDKINTERKIDSSKLSAWELVESGDSDGLKEMFIRGEISDIDARGRRDDEEFSLLTTASLFGQLDCVKLLLKYRRFPYLGADFVSDTGTFHF